MTPSWYLIQYDIRNKARLQRVYRLLKSSAIPVQESVFAWQGTHTELEQLQQQLLQRINPTEDDIRGYRIRQPLQLYGESPFIAGGWFTGYPPHVHKALC